MSRCFYNLPDWAMSFVGRGAMALLLLTPLCAKALQVQQQNTPPPQQQTYPAPSVNAGQAPVAPLPPPPPPPPVNAVVIDAAHGGADAGAKLQDADEKAVTLALGVRLRSLLSARGIPVVTTREADVAVDAARRAGVANHTGAIACISLHASTAGSGVHLFVSSLSESDKGRLGWKTAQAGYVTRSLKLANVMDSAINHAGVKVTLGRTSLPGVDSMACPAVAVEIAPLRDAGHKVTAGVDDAGYQANVAEALAGALLEWRTEAGQH